MTLRPEDHELNAYVRSCIKRVIRDSHIIDDLTQETWLTLLRHSNLPASSGKGWLGTVAHNLALQDSRSELRRRRREERAAQPEEAQTCDVHQDEIERVRRAFEGIKEPYRTVVGLRFFNDLPPTQIADKLSIPIETARTRLRRGLESLRKLYWLEGRRDGEKT